MDRVLRTIIYVLLIFHAASAEAALKILEGDHTVIYDIVNPRGVAFIPDYANENFEQKVIAQDEFSKRVRVISRMHAMRTRVPYPIAAGRIGAANRQYLLPEKDRQADDAAIRRLAQELAAGSRFAHEAANAILSWIADNITFDSSLKVPADAVSAFRYRKAYCVGFSNLAVALLRAAGIPARVAHGYLPPGYEWGFSKEYWGVKVNDGGFHAYLEIYYPDTGWVFSDAEHSHHFVDPFHLILRLDGMTMRGAYRGGYLDVDKATFYTIYQEVDRTSMVDELPLPKKQRLGRRMSETQYAALVSGRVVSRSGASVAKGTAVLWKDGRGTQHPFVDGRYSIAVANPGAYRLELKGPGFAKESRRLQIEKGRQVHQDFQLAPGGVIKGTVRRKDGRPVREGDVFYREGTTSYGVPIDQDGSYRIEGLSPGSYAVKVTIGDQDSSQDVSVAAGEETVQNFIVP